MSEETSFLDELAEQPSTEPEGQTEPEQTEAAAPEAEAGEQQTEASPPDAAEGESSKQDLSDKEKAFLRKAEDEARKRREAELELARLQGRMESTQTQPQEPEEDLGEKFWDNPEQVLKDREQRLMDQFETSRLKDRIAISERMVKAQHKDADEAFEAFQEYAKSNPAILQAFRQDSAPAYFAYETGKTYLQTKDIKDLDSLKAKMREEIRDELKKEMAIETAKGAPPSNAGARESGAAAAPDQSVDDLLSDIVA